MTRKQKRQLFTILLSSLLFLTVLLLPKNGWNRHLILCAFLVPYLTVGYSVLKKAVMNLCHGQVFDENFLMALATLGALVIGEYPEAVFVLLFYQIGELFESLAVGRSRRSITALMDLRPDTATVLAEEGEKTLSPEEVEIGAMLLVRPGEKVPLDGCVVEGTSTLNAVALTGESTPREVTVGDTVLSGCINGHGPLRVKVTRRYEESTASKILLLVEDSMANKAKSEALITRFAKYYTPFVVIAAFTVAILPSLYDGRWEQWIYRALSFLVISCPCALVISVPLTFFAGIGASSHSGILVKGSQYLERLASCETAVFDKTGTLTEGVFSVSEIHPVSGDKEELLALAATLEHDSGHPIAESIKRACRKESVEIPEEVRELVGRGLTGKMNGSKVYIGNSRLMQEIGVPCQKPSAIGTVLHLAKEKDYLGYLVIADAIKPGTGEALLAMKKSGVKQTVMLTGDVASVAEAVARTVAVDRTVAELLPDGKVAEVERLLSCQKKGKHLLFVGDGINDAPVLARADVGVAMGALGSDAAIEAADVVIMDDDLRRLNTAVGIARKTVAIVKQNIVFSLAVKAIVLILAVVGLCSMWVAVFADVGVMMLAVLNALRAMR